MEHVVKVNDLVKRYKELVAIDHLSLTVEKGEIFGLLGPNGSGKTTLINCILALLKFDHGEIEIFGTPMSSINASIKKQIGLVPQNVAVYEELTVQENIDYFCGLYVQDEKKRKALVEEAIHFVELEDFRHFHPSKLSGGLLRRLNLACGIAHKPRLLILDEPTVAVDPQSRNRILEGIRKLRDEGATVIYTSHYMEEIELLCDRLVILDHGKSLVEGTSHEILAQTSLRETVKVGVAQLSEAQRAWIMQEPAFVSPSYDGKYLQLQLRTSAMSAIDLIHRLEEKGISLLSIETERPTLNDVFLEITGKELRDHA